MSPGRIAMGRTFLAIADLLLLGSGMAIALGLHSWLHDQHGLGREVPRFEEYASVAYAALPIWLLLGRLFRLDQVLERRFTRFELLVELTKLHLLGGAMLATITYLTQSTLNRTVMVLFIGVMFALMYSTRVGLSIWLEFRWGAGLGTERLLLISDGGAELDAFLSDASESGLPPTVIGRLGVAGPPNAAVRQLGTSENLSRLLHDEAIDRVLFFPPYHHPDQVSPLVHACEAAGIPAAFAVDLVFRYPVAPTVVSLHQRPFITFDMIQHRPEAVAVKHAMDFVLSGITLLLLSPLLVLIAIAIFVTMGRPILFLQERVGHHGRRFRMFKFRTMVVDAEARKAELAASNEMTGPVFKMARDPRVTRLGAFLRKWSLDELPQFANVFLGSMSLVGPRPLPVPEQQEIAGWHRRRLSVRPGITGLWQVSGRSDIDFDEWMKLDLRYVEEWSLRLDLLLLLKTPMAVVSRRGAH